MAAAILVLPALGPLAPPPFDRPLDRYTPTRLNGQAVAVVLSVSITFTLR